MSLKWIVWLLFPFSFFSAKTAAETQYGAQEWNQVLYPVEKGKAQLFFLNQNLAQTLGFRANRLFPFLACWVRFCLIAGRWGQSPDLSRRAIRNVGKWAQIQLLGYFRLLFGNSSANRMHVYAACMQIDGVTAHGQQIGAHDDVSEGGLRA